MKILLSLLALFAFSGCASIVSKSTWPVTINSNPYGAKVMISDRDGIPVQCGETPMTVTLKSSSGFFRPARYRLEITKPGYQPFTATLSAHVNGWYAGNILFGGVIGLVIVDPATGAMWRLPENYMVNLPPRVAAAHKPGTMTVACIDQIPGSVRSKLVRIN